MSTDLIQRITLALSRTNKPQAIPRAIGSALAAECATRVELVLGRRVHVAVKSDGVWKTDRTKRSRPESKSKSDLRLALTIDGLESSLAISLGRGGKPIPDDPANLATLARIVELSIGYQLLIQRVADLSRNALFENRELRDTMQTIDDRDLVARSPAMKTVVDRIGLVARYDTAVLIRGESGVGKEVVARLIHKRSPRSRRPFVQINSGAIPEQLVESELFGHERGAFTGAERAHRGVFEQANGGVLLLDEIGDLPLPAQVKLLRVLQEGTFRRLGSERDTKVDVRVIAATNRPLESMIASGQFRQDLLYRLDVFPIDIPPLRERVDDIPALVDALLGRLVERLKLAKPRVDAETLAMLSAHTWPGNVRELSNVLESALIQGGGRRLDFGQRFVEHRRRTTDDIATFDSAARSAIAAALRKSGGKIYGSDGAAALLDLNPATLQSKMRKLGIKRQAFVS